MTHVRTPLSSGSLLSSGVTGHWSETLHKAAVTPLLAVWHKRHEAEIVRKKKLVSLYLQRSLHPVSQRGGSVFVETSHISVRTVAHYWKTNGMRLPQKTSTVVYEELHGMKDEMLSKIHGGAEEMSVTAASLLVTAVAMESPYFTHGSVSVNETTAQHSEAAALQTAICLPVFMFAGGAIGNLIAIIVLSVSRQERKSSAFYTLVCGLAVTDLLGTCLASPLTIANYLDMHVLKDEHVCEFHTFLLLFFGLTGISIIFAMAAERYLAICCPYTYQRWGVDRRFAQKFLFFIYMSHIFFCCLPMMGMARSELQSSTTWCFIDWRTQDPVSVTYSILYGAVSLLLILGTIALNLGVCASLLLMRQRTVQRPVTRVSVRDRWRALSSAAETQMITVLVLTSAVVLACSAPLVVSG